MIKRETVEKVIGKSFADKVDGEVFKVTIEWFYTRREMVEQLGCANFIAAAKLSKVLKRLKISTPKALWDMNPIDLARAKGVGEASIFVAMCILEANKFDVEKWWGWNDNVVKFSTFKSHAIARARKHKQEVA
jgi:hypothetical protein